MTYDLKLIFMIHNIAKKNRKIITSNQVENISYKKYEIHSTLKIEP